MPEEFFKVDMHIFDHPKIVDLSDAAFRTFLSSIAYANRLMTDGFVAQAIARRLHDCDPSATDPEDDWREHARELVNARLWDQVEGGWQIHNYAKHNRTRVDVMQQRAKWRKRQTDHRDAVTRDKDVTPGDVTRESRVSHGGVTRQEVEVEEEEEKRKFNTIVEQARPATAEIAAVFDAWKATLPAGSRRELTEPRREAIRAALRRYPFEDVRDAVQGWQNDPWEERSQHNDVGQLLWMGTRRKPQNVLEKMRDLHRDGPPAAAMTGRAAKHRQQIVATHTAMDGWAREVDAHADGGDGVAVDRGQAQRELPGPGDRA